MFDVGGNFISEKIQWILHKIEYSASNITNHHQSNGQVEACIDFVKNTPKMCIDTSADPHII